MLAGPVDPLRRGGPGLPTLESASFSLGIPEMTARVVRGFPRLHLAWRPIDETRSAGGTTARTPSSSIGGAATPLRGKGHNGRVSAAQPGEAVVRAQGPSIQDVLLSNEHCRASSPNSSVEI